MAGCSTTVFRAYKYRICPTPTQERQLGDILFNACLLYNHSLEFKKREWSRSRRSHSCYDLSAVISSWRNEGEDNPLAAMPLMTARLVVREMDIAYTQFVRGKKGFPRFKSARRFRTVKYDNGWKIDGDKLQLFKIGSVLVKWSRDLPEGKIKQVAITRKASGWYACFVCEVELETVKSDNPAIGIDVGVSHALALSDGAFVDSPRHLEQSMKKLRVLQRSVARKKKGGSNRRKAVKLLARQYERVQDARRDFWHKATTEVVSNYGKIAVEDLPLAFMVRNKNLARAAHDVSLGIFFELLKYKAEEAGVEVVKVNPKNTSQMCSRCGQIVKKSLSTRVHRCDCGLVLDRDTNAAINIKQAGQAIWAQTYGNSQSVAQEAVEPRVKTKPVNLQAEGVLL